MNQLVAIYGIIYNYEIFVASGVASSKPLVGHTLREGMGF